MIPLQKLSITRELEAAIEARTKRFLELKAAGEEVPKALEAAYKLPEIKALLKKETGDKCAYCECKISHVDYGDVEHIIPKSIKPELRFRYENLTFACGICNTKKSDFYSEKMPLLNPYVDSMENHLIAVGPMVLRVPTSDRGLLTQKKLDLNRTALVERRQERLESIATLVDQMVRTDDSSIRDVLVEEIRRECESDKEFAFVVRTYVKEIESHLE